MKEKPKIVFAHDNINQNTLGIMAGINEYIQNEDSWQLIIWPESSAQSLSFLKQRGCKGAFVSTATSSKAQQLLKVGMPIIAMVAMQETFNLPYISANSGEIAKLACEYFLNRKFENFAFFGLTEAKWSLERMELFSSYLAKAGHKVNIFKEDEILATDNFLAFTTLWTDTTLKKKHHFQLAEWLRQLPKPVAILASCDILACHLTDIAKDVDLQIPNEVAILGINDDHTICSICDPPLSSISLNFRKAGYDAAKLLDELILGEQSMDGQHIEIQPIHIESRGSTEIFAINDPDIIQVLSYIRQNSNKPMQVDEIANNVYISKRSLQLKFRKILGRSIHDEIINAHFENAKTMLIETNLSIDKIAVQSGFVNTPNMRRAFIQLTGMLPKQYRQIHSLQ
ncbi:MAG: DNA-binding transcriptional regulator [Sedimentisphaerales bacterium]|nr:DNA-binding transcriptional regulator [Sedimentisphaerales bacterium]